VRKRKHQYHFAHGEMMANRGKATCLRQHWRSKEEQKRNKMQEFQVLTQSINKLNSPNPATCCCCV